MVLQGCLYLAMVTPKRIMVLSSSDSPTRLCGPSESSWPQRCVERTPACIILRVMRPHRRVNCATFTSLRRRGGGCALPIRRLRAAVIFALRSCALL
jgi:hypothetical protein